MNMMIQIILSLTIPILLGCSADSPKPIPHWINATDTMKFVSAPFPGEEKKTEKTYPSDMVLLYGGGHHRKPFCWDQDRMSSYVTFKDRSGKEHWLFDGFLLLEFMDPAVNGGPGKTFVTGYKYQGEYMPSADKTDWQNLIDYYFMSGSGVDAIENAVAAAEKRIGAPQEKRKIVIGIPEPITFLYSATKSGGTSYWGMLDGKTLDFKNLRDRILACRWYIDEVRRQFYSKHFQHVELAGFYWVAETSQDTDTILKPLSKYLDQLDYSFKWIPFFNAAGYTRWKEYGFDAAYLQPNYFFNASIPKSRLEEACDLALKYDMDMEIEFDEKVQVQYGFEYKLRDYMEVFRKRGIWASHRLAYYQGSWAVYVLSRSGNTEEQELYQDFCSFVTGRPVHQ